MDPNTTRTHFEKRRTEGTSGSCIWIEDLSDFQKVASVSTHQSNDNGGALITIALDPAAMRALAEDLTLAAALVEENINRKKKAA